MRRQLAVLLLGMMAGGILVTIYHAARLEQLYFDKEKLQVELFDTTDRLLKLESLWSTHQDGEITAVTIELEGAVTPFAQLELTRLVHDITGDLVGEKIEDLNPELLIALLNRRKLTVEQKDYLLTVNWLIVSRQTVFNLTASPVD